MSRNSSKNLRTIALLAVGLISAWGLIFADEWWSDQRLYNGILWRTLHPVLAVSRSFEAVPVHKCEDMKCSQVMVEGKNGIFYLYGTRNSPQTGEMVRLKINGLSQVFMCGNNDGWCMTVNVVCPGQKWPPQTNITTDGQLHCYRLFRNPWALTKGADEPAHWAPLLGLPVSRN